jgi:sulfur-carrier protein
LKVTVQYFALLREQRGCGEETLETGEITTSELYRKLAVEHGLSMTPESMKVVVNEEFSTWDRAITDGDVIVFIPPVAGG